MEKLNQSHGKCIAAYTFDAGPNAVVYFLEKDLNILLSELKSFLPIEVEGFKQILAQNIQNEPGVSLKDIKLKEGKVRRLIHTKVGSGPKVID